MRQAFGLSETDPFLSLSSQKKKKAGEISCLYESLVQSRGLSISSYFFSLGISILLMVIVLAVLSSFPSTMT